jgi:hypothetical protein
MPNSISTGQAAGAEPRTYIVVHGNAYHLGPGGGLLSSPIRISGAPDFNASAEVDYARLGDKRAEIALREIERSLGWLASAGIEASLAP